MASETRDRYIATLQVLSRWLSSHVNEQEHPWPEPYRSKRWSEFDFRGAIIRAGNFATELRLPPAVWIDYVSLEDAQSRGLNIEQFPDVAPAAKWRIGYLRACSVGMDKRQTWPLCSEEQLADGWILRSFLRPGGPDDVDRRRRYRAGWEMSWFLAEWGRFLALVPCPGGYIDTPFAGWTWQGHCDYQANAAAAHIRAFYNPEREKIHELPPEIRRTIEIQTEQVQELYKRAQLTAHFAKCAISNYLARLIKDQIDEPQQYRQMYREMAQERTEKSRQYALTHLAQMKDMEERDRSQDEKRIADDVRHFCRLVIPLDLAEAPDMPTAERVSNTDAIALLDRLRKCCIRRMEVEGDPRSDPSKRGIPTISALPPPALQQPAPLALPAPAAPVLDGVTEEKWRSPAQQAIALGLPKEWDDKKRAKRAQRIRAAYGAKHTLRTKKFGTAEHIHEDDLNEMVRWDRGGRPDPASPAAEQLKQASAAELSRGQHWWYCEKCDGKFKWRPGMVACPQGHRGISPWQSETG